jgi:threonine dehydrogenase-like Zn-dependent dehydrogenase
MPMGREYCGIVEEVGKAVSSIKPDQFVIGSFIASEQHLSALPQRLPDLVPAHELGRDLFGRGRPLLERGIAVRQGQRFYSPRQRPAPDVRAVN